MPDGVCNWEALLARGRMRLERAGIEESENKLRWVLSHLLGCGLLDGVRYGAEIPTPGQARQFEAAMARLETDEPVQYVVGETDFMGLRMQCDSRALIPRPETEQLVECAEAFLRGQPGRPVVVDVCTGTGCIACALAKRMPTLHVWATELSSDALDLARQNAQALGVEVKFFLGDLLEGKDDASVDVVISNPPYIASAECGRLDRTVRAFEPRLALDGGPDGLRVISRLVEEAARVLSSAGRLMMEIGDDQAETAMEILCRTPQFKNQKLLFDYAGRARVVTSERTSR